MKDKTPDEAAKVFRALSVETRVAIIRLLADRTLCVNALSNRIGVSPGAVSQHLRILKDAGLVESDRRGFYVHYSLAPDAADRCRETLASLFEGKAASTKGEKACARKRRSARSRKN